MNFNVFYVYLLLFAAIEGHGFPVATIRVNAGLARAQIREDLECLKNRIFAFVEHGGIFSAGFLNWLLRLVPAFLDWQFY